LSPLFIQAVIQSGLNMKITITKIGLDNNYYMHAIGYA